MMSCIHAIPVATVALALTGASCAEPIDGGARDELGESTQAVLNGGGTWFDEKFASLAGWQQWEADAPVVATYDANTPRPSCDSESTSYLKCKAPPGKFEGITKIVKNLQSNGTQYFEFWARANGKFLSDIPSASKVFLENDSTKLVQVYIGSTGIRINAAGGSAGLATASGTFEPNRWYLVSCDLFLDEPRHVDCRLINEDPDACNSFVQGDVSSLSVGSGTLKYVSIFSWPFNEQGAITLDDMFGTRIF